MSEEIEISQKQIESRIFTIRGVQVMIDSDLAEMYGVETRALNQAVRRNIERFPEDFVFQLSSSEWECLNSKSSIISATSQNVLLNDKHLVSQNVIASSHGGRRTLPYVYTEQGVAGLSGVLKSKIAAKVHVEIMRAFVSMRRFLIENASVFQRLDKVEFKQLESEQKFEQIFKALESKKAIPTQGIFFDGQVFDAYKFVSDLIRSASSSIILIDNYIDDNTLTILSKKEKNIKVTLLTKTISKQLALDIKKANEQYGNFEIREFVKSHDRFLIIDDTEIYHLGASLKDLGKKWFAFSKMNIETLNLLDKV